MKHYVLDFPVKIQSSRNTHLHQCTPIPTHVHSDGGGEGRHINTLLKESVGVCDAEGVVEAGGGCEHCHILFLTQHHLELGESL